MTTEPREFWVLKWNFYDTDCWGISAVIRKGSNVYDKKEDAEADVTLLGSRDSYGEIELIHVREVRDE